jgi:hypothetical protein
VDNESSGKNVTPWQSKSYHFRKPKTVCVAIVQNVILNYTSVTVSNVKINVIHFSETEVNLYQIVRKQSNFHGQCHEQIKSRCLRLEYQFS